MTAHSFESAKTLLISKLKSHGLRLRHQDPVNHAAFGNTYADFETNGLLVRLVLDRGQLLLSVAAINDLEASPWYPADSVLEFLGRLPQVERDEPIAIDEAINVLDSAFPEVSDLFRRFPASKVELDQYLRRQSQ